MVGFLLFTLFWGLVAVAIFSPGILRPLPPGHPQEKIWAYLSVLFGVVAGPLALLSMRNAGYGAFLGVIWYALILPPLGAAIARSRRPLLFGLIGNVGYIVGLEVLYLIGSPWIADSGWPGVVLLIIALPSLAAILTCLPSQIRIRRSLTR